MISTKRQHNSRTLMAVLALAMPMAARDKITGCTAELGKFRDEYTTIFGMGDDVVVLPISVDGIESHARWSSEMHFPFALLSDTTQAVSAAKG